MDLEELALVAQMYGSSMQRESAREANETNIRLAREASAFSSAQAERQMEFQREMSSTAHQREMADLIAAGLNPILTATGGAGASMAAGAMGHAAQAEVMSTQKDNPYESLAQDVLAARKFRDLEMEMMRSNVAVNRSAMATQDTQRTLNSALAAKALEEGLSEQAQRGYLDSQEQYLSALRTKTLIEAVNEEKRGKQLEQGLEKGVLDIKGAEAGLPKKETEAWLYERPLGKGLEVMSKVLPGLSAGAALTMLLKGKGSKSRKIGFLE